MGHGCVDIVAAGIFGAAAAVTSYILVPHDVVPEAFHAILRPFILLAAALGALTGGAVLLSGGRHRPVTVPLGVFACVLLAGGTCVIAIAPYSTQAESTLRTVWNTAANDHGADVCTWMQQQRCVGWTSPCIDEARKANVNRTRLPDGASSDARAACPSNCSVAKLLTAQAIVAGDANLATCRDVVLDDLHNWTLMLARVMGGCALVAAAALLRQVIWGGPKRVDYYGGGMGYRQNVNSHDRFLMEDGEIIHGGTGNSCCNARCLGKTVACVFIVILFVLAPAAAVAYTELEMDLSHTSPMYGVTANSDVVTVTDPSQPYLAAFSIDVHQGANESQAAYRWYRMSSGTTGSWVEFNANGPNATVRVADCHTPQLVKAVVTAPKYSPWRYEAHMNATCIALNSTVTTTHSLSDEWRFVNCSVDSDGNVTGVVLESYRFNTAVPSNIRVGHLLVGESPTAWRQWMDPFNQQPCFALRNKISRVATEALRNGAVRLTVNLTHATVVDTLAAAHVYLPDVTSSTMRTLTVPLPPEAASSESDSQAVAGRSDAGGFGSSFGSLFMQTVKVHEAITLGDGISGSVGVQTQGSVGKIGAEVELALHVPVHVSKNNGHTEFSVEIEGDLTASISVGVEVEETENKKETKKLYHHPLFGCDKRWCGFFIGVVPVRLRPTFTLLLKTDLDAAFGFATSGSITAKASGSVSASYTMGGSLQHSSSWSPSMTHQFTPPHIVRCEATLNVGLPFIVKVQADGLAYVATNPTPGLQMNVGHGAVPSCPGVNIPLIGEFDVSAQGGLTPGFLRHAAFDVPVLSWSRQLYAFCVGERHCQTYYSCSPDWKCVKNTTGGPFSQSACNSMCSNTVTIQGWKDPGLLQFGCHNAPDHTWTMTFDTCVNADVEGSGKNVGSYRMKSLAPQGYSLTYYEGADCRESTADVVGSYPFDECVHRPWMHGNFWVYPYWIVSLKPASGAAAMTVVGGTHSGAIMPPVNNSSQQP